MQIQLSYEKEFDELWEQLKNKYPQKLFDLEGIGKQLDMAWFSKNFFNRNKNNVTTADISVDANANVDDMSVVSYDAELMKPFERLNSMYMLWKYSRTYYGTDFANEVVEKQLIGDFYINDFHHFFTKPYCFNYSTYDIIINIIKRRWKYIITFYRKTKNKYGEYLNEKLAELERGEIEEKDILNFEEFEDRSIEKRVREITNDKYNNDLMYRNL